MERHFAGQLKIKRPVYTDGEGRRPAESPRFYQLIVARSAEKWALVFVKWYNTEHRHSAIRFVTPEQRHEGLDGEILNSRHRVYKKAGDFKAIPTSLRLVK